MDDLWARLADFEKRIDYATVERDGALAHSASTESGGIGIVLGKDSHGNCFVLDLIPVSKQSECVRLEVVSVWNPIIDVRRGRSSRKCINPSGRPSPEGHG